MNRIRHIRHLRRIGQLGGILASLAGLMLGLGADTPAAFATEVPPPGGSTGPALAPVHTIVVGGMPGWQITLIAVAAALAAAALAVLLDRARSPRQLTAPAS